MKIAECYALTTNQTDEDAELLHEDFRELVDGDKRSYSIVIADFNAKLTKKTDKSYLCIDKFCYNEKLTKAHYN